MNIYTDSISFADELLDESLTWRPVNISQTDLDPGRDSLFLRFFGRRPFFQAESENWEDWQAAFLVEWADQSHYDLLVDLSRTESALLDKILCLAGSGSHCHGQRGRPWIALPGNLHLTVSFTPMRRIEGFGSGFPALAAVSVIQTLDEIESIEKKASIKWVNDVLINDAKVAGFLAHGQSKDSVVSCAILGIGLNVTQSPDIKSDPFVPKAAALSSFSSDKKGCSQKEILRKLLVHLNENYNSLLDIGAAPLVEFYKERSGIMGRNVRIFSDPLEGEPELIAAGKILDIGENLELYLEGEKKPVSRGRLILD